MLNLERELRKYKVADIEVRDRAREELGDINGMIRTYAKSDFFNRCA